MACDSHPGPGRRGRGRGSPARKDDIPTGRGEREGALGGRDGLIIRAHEAELLDQKARDLPSRRGSSRAAGEGLRLAQQSQDTPEVTQRPERRAQGKPEVDGLLARVVLLWQMREGAERLLEGAHGLAVGRLRHGLAPPPAGSSGGLLPHLALGEWCASSA